MTVYYILNDKHEAIPADLETWSIWFETSDRIVKQEAAGPNLVYFVSTVFLGLDHNFRGMLADEPLLFETMVFDPSGNVRHCARCSTWDEALEQHERVAKLFETRPLFEEQR